MAVEVTEGAPLALDETDRRRVIEVARFLETYRPSSRAVDGLMLTASDGRQQTLPAPLLDALQVLSAILARGDDAAIVPLDKDVSMDEAATLLNVSRPFVERLLADGTIPTVEVPAVGGDTGKRIRLRDVLAYRQRRGDKSRRLLDEALSFAQEHGGYD